MKLNINRKTINPILTCAIAGTLLWSCSKSDDKKSTTTSSTNYAVGGKLTSLTASGYIRTYSSVEDREIETLSTKTITHVMAISPQASNPQRFIGQVGADGSFELGIVAGAPYILVFIDDTQTGENMIVGIYDPGDATTGLDTLLPAEEGSANLGDVSINGTSQIATMSTTFSDFLSALGIDSTTATTIGAVDDLSLRAANPDVDSNGEIDQIEGKNFFLDFHIRTNVTCTTYCSSNSLGLTAILGTYVSDVAGFAISPSLKSMYAVHDETFDATSITTYIPSSGVSTTLSGGAAFSATAMTGSSATINAPTSFSGGKNGDYRSWGPDYNGSTEMPGYNGLVKVVYTTGTSNSNKTLTWSHVRTRTNAAFFQLLPDIKINATGNTITSIDYRWRKWSGSAWVAATTDEVQALVSGDGAYFTLYTYKVSGSEKGASFYVPASEASGTIAWEEANFSMAGGESFSNVSLSTICSGVSSYDDKLGLRNFTYSMSPISGGPTHCP